MNLKLFSAGLFFIVSVVVAIDDLEIWERRCLLTHNQLRGARGISAVGLSPALKDVADMKGLHVVMEDYNMQIHGINTLNSDDLQKERISFNIETVSKTFVLPQSSYAKHFKLRLFLSITAEDLITEWYKDGLFFPEKKEKYNRLMDPSVDQIGCALHYVPDGKDVYKLYLVVSYQQNKMKLNKTVDSKTSTFNENPNKYARSYSMSDRTCNINCTDAGSCYSHKNSKLRFVSRVGGDRQGSAAYQNHQQACKCEFDAELWELGTNIYKETPVCLGPCFVYCPFAKDGSKISCHGKTMCTCKYAEGGAKCD